MVPCANDETMQRVSTYLTDPSDAVAVTGQFAKLPDGTNHIAILQVNGVSKQLGVAVQNSGYQLLH
jgi:hypothetical protein